MKYLCVSEDLTQLIPANLITDCMTALPNGYVMQSVTMLGEQPTLTDIFAMPITDDLAQMWSLGFGLPMLCYLVAYCYGVVVNMFDHH